MAKILLTNWAQNLHKFCALFGQWLTQPMFYYLRQLSRDRLLYLVYSCELYKCSCSEVSTWRLRSPILLISLDIAWCWLQKKHVKEKYVSYKMSKLYQILLYFSLCVLVTRIARYIRLMYNSWFDGIPPFQGKNMFFQGHLSLSVGQDLCCLPWNMEKHLNLYRDIGARCFEWPTKFLAHFSDYLVVVIA